MERRLAGAWAAAQLKSSHRSLPYHHLQLGLSPAVARVLVHPRHPFSSSYTLLDGVCPSLSSTPTLLLLAARLSQPTSPTLSTNNASKSPPVGLDRPHPPIPTLAHLHTTCKSSSSSYRSVAEGVSAQSPATRCVACLPREGLEIHWGWCLGRLAVEYAVAAALPSCRKTLNRVSRCLPRNVAPQCIHPRFIVVFTTSRIRFCSLTRSGFGAYLVLSSTRSVLRWHESGSSLQHLL